MYPAVSMVSGWRTKIFCAKSRPEFIEETSANIIGRPSGTAMMMIVTAKRIVSMIRRKVEPPLRLLALLRAIKPNTRLITEYAAPAL